MMRQDEGVWKGTGWEAPERSDQGLRPQRLPGSTFEPLQCWLLRFGAW